MFLGYVYILVDPRHKEGHHKHVRYVGITNNLQKRMTDHWVTKCKRRTHKGNWLQNLESAGYDYPIYEVVEEVWCRNRKELGDVERFWITQFKAWGFALTNMTSGGEGMIDLCAESRKKLGESTSRRLKLMGDKHPSKSDAFRKSASARLKDPNHPIRSEAARKKQSDLRKGRMTGDDNPARRPEVREKISKAKSGDHHHAKTQAWKDYFSNLMKGRFAGDKNPSKKPGVGEKISAGRKGLCVGTDHPKSKSVLCVETGEIFVTIEKAAVWLRENGYPKASSSNISGVCNGRCKKAHGYTWRFVQKGDTL